MESSEGKRSCRRRRINGSEKYQLLVSKSVLAVCAVVILMLAGVLAYRGVSSAYLMHELPWLDNPISAGKVEIRLLEDQWRENDASAMLPGTTVSKNPQIENTGKEGAWVFLEVSIPCQIISIVDADTKRKKDKALTELFSFTADEVNWQLLEDQTDPSEMVRRQVYFYRTPLLSGQKTEALFSSVTIADYLEGELTPEEVLLLHVKAFALQSEQVTGDGQELYHCYLEQVERDKEVSDY